MYKLESSPNRKKGFKVCDYLDSLLALHLENLLKSLICRTQFHGSQGGLRCAENGVTLERWAGPGQNCGAENVFQRHCPQLYSWPLIPLGTSLGAQGPFSFF